MSMEPKCLDPKFKEHYIWQRMDKLYREFAAGTVHYPQLTRGSYPYCMSWFAQIEISCKRFIQYGKKDEFYNARTLKWVQGEQARAALTLTNYISTGDTK